MWILNSSKSKPITKGLNWIMIYVQHILNISWNKMNSTDLECIEYIEYASFVSINWFTLVNVGSGKINFLDILLLGGFKDWTEFDIKEGEISLDLVDLCD